MIFLKLGGSLITDKSQPQRARTQILNQAAAEIAAAYQEIPGLQLVLAHGSGSFGHIAAARYGTQQGASTPEQWRGFAHVWAVANLLNRLVVDALREHGLPVISLPPSAATIARGGRAVAMFVEPIERALQAGLLPLLQGDTVFDRQQGATILSTERVFAYLAPRLKPDLILLAGIEQGVYADYPQRTRLLPELDRAALAQAGIGASQTTDVTGGMAAKVAAALEICQALPQVQIRIFSGEEPGSLLRALRGEPLGTLIRP